MPGSKSVRSLRLRRDDVRASQQFRAHSARRSRMPVWSPFYESRTTMSSRFLTRRVAVRPTAAKKECAKHHRVLEHRSPRLVCRTLRL